MRGIPILLTLCLLTCPTCTLATAAAPDRLQAPPTLSLTQAIELVERIAREEPQPPRKAKQGIAIPVSRPLQFEAMNADTGGAVRVTFINRDNQKLIQIDETEGGTTRVVLLANSIRSFPSVMENTIDLLGVIKAKATIYQSRFDVTLYTQHDILFGDNAAIGLGKHGTIAPLVSANLIMKAWAVLLPQNDFTTKFPDAIEDSFNSIEGQLNPGVSLSFMTKPERGSPGGPRLARYTHIRMSGGPALSHVRGHPEVKLSPNFMVTIEQSFD